jgi:CDP-glucose 4,6-dehydratase
LGSWLVRALIEQQAEVVALIRDWPPKSELIRSGDVNRIRVVRGDVQDYDLIHRTLNEYEVDTIFHLAALTIVPISTRAPLATFETNIKGSWTVFEAARYSPLVSRVLLASSDKAYGAQKKLPYTEDMPLLAIHPYDVSKACAEMLAVNYYHTYNLPVCITRCANLYGGGDLNFNRLVPEVVRAALLNQQPVIRSDGSMRRDYLFVEDAVRAYMTLAQKMDDPAIHGQAFNFGVDNPTSVLDMTRMILSLSPNPDLEPIIENRELKEIQDQYLSSEKANRILGWKPSYSMQDGIQKTLAWYEAFFRDEGLIK